MSHLTTLPLLAVLAALPAEVRAAPEPRLTGVHVVARLADEGVATTSPVVARASRKAILSVVAVVTEGGRERIYGDVPVRLPGRRGVITPEPWPSLPVRIRWWRIEPDTVGQSFDNTAPSYHYDPIPYAETAILGAQQQWSLVADPRPTLLPSTDEWIGTMRYKAEVTALGATLATPGAERRTLGGPDPAVLRVSYEGERGHAYVNALLAHFHQPYIWGSMGPSDRRHQAELFIGADCADLLTAAYRRWSGKDVAYGWSASFLPGGAYAKKHGRVVARKASRAPDGVIRDAGGQPVTVGPGETAQIGDVVVLPRHVGVLSEDRAPLGVLDDNDLIIHTLFAEPREEPLLRRWPNVLAIFRWHQP
ncbi:MAG: hypothetical protein AMXMBFR64_46300 [Myxococcales bacterium]